MKGAEAGLLALKVLCDNRKQPQFLLLPPGSKEENDNSSFIKRGPARGAHGHARLWGTSPAGARLGQGCRGVLQMGRGSQAERKPPCPAGPARAWEPGLAGREGPRDPSQHGQYGHSSGCHRGSCKKNAASPVAHNKPSPTFLQHTSKKRVKLIVWVFFKIKFPCTYFSANRQPVPQALIQQGLSLTSVVLSFHRATNVAMCTHTHHGMQHISKSGISTLYYLVILMCSKIRLAYAMKQCR